MLYIIMNTKIQCKIIHVVYVCMYIYVCMYTWFLRYGCPDCTEWTICSEHSEDAYIGCLLF